MDRPSVRANTGIKTWTNYACAVEFHLSLEGRRDLAGQMYRQFREAIVDGRLKGRRDLAAQPGAGPAARRVT